MARAGRKRTKSKEALNKYVKPSVGVNAKQKFTFEIEMEDFHSTRYKQPISLYILTDNSVTIEEKSLSGLMGYNGEYAFRRGLSGERASSFVPRKIAEENGIGSELYFREVFIATSPNDPNNGQTLWLVNIDQANFMIQAFSDALDSQRKGIGAGPRVKKDGLMKVVPYSCKAFINRYRTIENACLQASGINLDELPTLPPSSFSIKQEMDFLKRQLILPYPVEKVEEDGSITRRDTPDKDGKTKYDWLANTVLGYAKDHILPAGPKATGTAGFETYEQQFKLRFYLNMFSTFANQAFNNTAFGRVIADQVKDKNPLRLIKEKTETAMKNLGL